MKNKYNNLIEEINMQEEIVEKKDNLTEQLSQVTKDVNTLKSIVTKLADVVTDMQKIVLAVTAASKSTDNAVNACIIRPIPVQFPEVLQGTSEA